MPKLKTEELSYSSKELETELARLKPLLGQLTTSDQIKVAYREREIAMFKGDENKIKTDVFWKYLRSTDSLLDGKL